MEFDNKLYLKLDKVRQKLKNIGKRIEGRMPTVCTDEALFEMVRLLPRTEEDMLCVPGLGQKFVDNYASHFISTIKNHVSMDAPKEHKLSESARDTLKELEKKLININRRNRLLYMPKISNKHAYDLFDSDGLFDPMDIIFSGKSLKICDISTKSTLLGQNGADKYKRLVLLIREVNRTFREKGQFDLFIGYPFVKGKLLGEEFNVRAPLALFPVEIVREADHITLQLDDSKDIIFNNHLILAHYKFNNISRALPNNVVEDFSQADFISALLSFYASEGIRLLHKEQSLFKFQDYTADEFPTFERGEMVLDYNIVLGNFPTFASSLQKDFNSIIEQEKITSVLAELLTAVDDIASTDNDTGEEIDKDDTPLTLSEHDLTYISELNSAQEHVLSVIKDKEAVVMQGPPGTGKSQTITSLIADHVNRERGNGRNVLLISEKKAALDVVYSRLGELNKFAIQIDDTNNKRSFYDQLEKFFYINSRIESREDNIKELADTVDEHIKRLEKLANKLYSANEFGIEIYKLFIMNHRIDLSNPPDAEKFKLLESSVSPDVHFMKYQDLNNMYKKFQDAKLLESVKRYIDLISLVEWFGYIRDDLSEYELYNLKQHLIQGLELSQWKKENLLKKICKKRKYVKHVHKIINIYFSHKDRKLLKLFLNRSVKVEDVSLYNDYVFSKSVFSSLSVKEQQFYHAIRQVALKLNTEDGQANQELFNFIVSKFLYDFEAKNREVLQYVGNFNEIISTLNAAILKKQNLTKHLLESLMRNDLNYITHSKRQGEIARIINSKRKWSITRFIQKFQFELFKGIRVWLLTPEVASEILPLKTGLFDLVIFDEASQMFIEKGIPAIARANKVIIAGDTKQLRPSNLGAGRIDLDEEVNEDEDTNAALEEDSLLDLATYKFIPPVLLNFHYRSKYEELIAFSNYAFYKGRLYVSPNVESPDSPPIEVIKVDDGLWVNRCNRSEAQKVVMLLKEFFKQRTMEQTVGIITFNSSQRNLIEDLIDEECVKDPTFSSILKREFNRKENGEDVSLFVKNIENVQGDERDVIMFSVGYAKNENGRLIRNFGWLNQKGGENRLNVAITRAKEKVIIVTSFFPYELQVEDAQNNGPKFLKKYLEYAFAVSEGEKEKAEQILMSFVNAENREDNFSFDGNLETQVYDALCDRGLTVETRVGIGGYRVDLAIKKADKYILGIECDGKLYSSSKSARERDYHRQKYLESRGWNIHRIWSYNWWRNPSREIDKIVKIVDTIH